MCQSSLLHREARGRLRSYTRENPSDQLFYDSPTQRMDDTVYSFVRGGSASALCLMMAKQRRSSQAHRSLCNTINRRRALALPPLTPHRFLRRLYTFSIRAYHATVFSYATLYAFRRSHPASSFGELATLRTRRGTLASLALLSQNDFYRMEPIADKPLINVFAVPKFALSE